MIALFKSNKKQVSEAQLKADIDRRAEINSEARRMAANLSKQAEAEKAVKVSKTILNKETMLLTLDTILDGIDPSIDNIKISTLCELRNAIESGDAKDLIKFLKSKDKAVVVKKKKLKKTWVL